MTDLTAFLKEGAVADLDWLDVDEAKYRKLDALPKQNLDVRPDLEALWSRDGDTPTTYLLPNHIPVDAPGPRTMGDLSVMHGMLRSEGEEIRRVASMCLVRSASLPKLRAELLGRFSAEALRTHRAVLAEVLQERGLVGRYYVDASDFPGCAKGGKAAAFVAKYAATAKYVVAKSECEGCCHAHTTVGGERHCGQFHKQITVDLPFTDGDALEVEQAQQAGGRSVDASSGGVSPRDRIRRAYLAPLVGRVDERYSGPGLDRQARTVVSAEQSASQLIQASGLLKKKRAMQANEMAAKPVVEFVHRQMVKGETYRSVLAALKSSFDYGLLERTYPHWGPLLKESGAYGVVYSKQASFDDCHDGASFIAKHSPGIRAIVAGDKCSTCIYNRHGCMVYDKPLIKSAAEIVTPETVNAVLLEHRAAGRLPPIVKSASEWGTTPLEALRRIHAETAKPAPTVAAPRLGMQEGFFGAPRSLEPVVVKRVHPVVKQASRYMNEGLYGEELFTLLRSKFAKQDIVAAQKELRAALAEQGLQGVYYVDPTIYDDYGKGCDEASRLHGTRLVQYVKMGSCCSGCVHQVAEGRCSKLNKQLVAEPPYTDKRAQQREILASGKATVVSYESLMNNGTSMVKDFQMQHAMRVDVMPEAVRENVDVRLNRFDVLRKTGDENVRSKLIPIANIIAAAMSDLQPEAKRTQTLAALRRCQNGSHTVHDMLIVNKNVFNAKNVAAFGERESTIQRAFWELADEGRLRGALKLVGVIG